MDILAQTDEFTVISEYTPSEKTAKSYQNETELEKEFIQILQNNGYEYVKFSAETELFENLRDKIERLNSYKFSDKEWEKFKAEYITNPNEGILAKTKRIQQDHQITITRENGESKNISLIDKANLSKNFLQVTNQFVAKANRYDVTVLINGLPLVHCEIKRRGVNIKEAFNQINRYQKESFGGSLYEFVQIFVISNGTMSKYYSNTTRDLCLNERGKAKKVGASYEFTSFWADAKNRRILDLVDFAKTFFAKNTILNLISKYCVFNTENRLLVMRPYQITACERIIERLKLSKAHGKISDKQAGGYIWHTTGSGKTLTSFKTAQLALNLEFVDKVLFVVDRKDLDFQTMREYDKFQKGAANSNTSTKKLLEQLENDNAKLIITTIQKLSILTQKYQSLGAYNKNVVIIFDECHRNQFGTMHGTIKMAFKRHYMFGFTGTPIFAVNSGDKATTEQIFGDKLHAYTIVNAIGDKNVLPFRVDYVRTIKEKENIKDEKIIKIDEKAVLNDERRISNIVSYILENFANKTANGAFNSIFGVSSIETAKLYYNEFKKQQNGRDKKLKIATVFSYAQNEELSDFLPDESLETDNLDIGSKEFLGGAIAEYNAMFGTSYSVESGDKNGFEAYYKNLQERLKKRELDLVIVVNMLLTGFDAPRLNTLWLDKNLIYHGLIQAFSRTNRILNSVKAYGNIVSFRDLNNDVTNALSLFGDENASSIVLMRTYDEYMDGYTDAKGEFVVGYRGIVGDIMAKFGTGEIPAPMSKKKEFIKLYNGILRLRNILKSFDEFASDTTLSERDLQDLQSIYLEIYEDTKRLKDDEKSLINEDVEFEIELLRQVEISVDYILLLVDSFRKTGDKEIKVKIEKAVESSLELRSKKELINEFITNLNGSDDVVTAWAEFMAKRQKEALEAIITEFGLKAELTNEFIDNAFERGKISFLGVAFSKILPKMSLFGGHRAEKIEKIQTTLQEFFEKFLQI